MTKRVLQLSSVLFAMSAFGCSAEAPSSPSAAASAPGAVGATSDAGAATVNGTVIPTGVVVIDVQNSFVTTASRRNANAQIATRVANDARIVELANRKHLPFFITYEGSKSGRSALAPELAPMMPADAKEFIKTTFAATGQPSFAAAVQASGLKRLLVVGAETDVCVLQTMLGLRKLGFTVVTAHEANFTEEVNVAPATRRMKQAGIESIAMNDVEALLDGRPVGAAESETAPVIARPLEMGFVLVNGWASTSDRNAVAKHARLKELLLLSEWFSRPVFAEDPAAVTAALSPDLRNILTKPVQSLASRPGSITQLTFAGGAAGAAEAAARLRAGGVETFLAEDVLVGDASPFEGAYAAGVVPTTYKTTYYELTKSIDDREWPSPQWVTASSKYYDLTSSPEDLPQLAP